MTNADNSTSSANRLTAEEASAIISPMSREQKLLLLGYLRQIHAQQEAGQAAGGAA